MLRKQQKFLAIYHTVQDRKKLLPNMKISEFSALPEIETKFPNDERPKSPHAYKNLISSETTTVIKEKSNTEIAPEKQVIVHCHYYNHGMADQIRIWETTYLIAKNHEYRSQLINAYNIAKYPKFMTTIPNVPHKFTLIFEALPEECKLFDLLEDIPETGGFYIHNIRRNKTDIYDLKINYY